MRRLAGAILFGLATIQGAEAADRLTLVLDWFVNPDHAPIVVAAEKGYFAEENLEVEIVPPADPSAPPRLVAAGQADVAITYQPNLYLQVEEGLPLVRFGTLVATPLNALVALEDGPVKSLADLKGKSVGYSVAGFEEVLLEAMLKDAGLAKDDVTLVNVNFALSPALIAHKVDAVIGAYRNFELTQLEIEGHPGRAFYPEEAGVPPFDELIFVARKESVGDDRLTRFMTAIEKAALYIANHPDDGLKLFLKAHPDLDDALNRRAYADTLPRFSRSPAALDRLRYKRFAAFLAEHGLIKKALPVDDYAVALE
ncbi:ABC transporter substrate-binding protein [Propylenella binzhouense]|uniref:ABC transporter ATP-binding protein n=1 Tax=Propylenella binzhouense TaxID=2555902 RepID=A0A964WVC0_9HYPH|nr:ABC transporter substrate-binding protein [Propylenella binzhouense]MYZ49893.1 ABC transporter ATP-binding protein [Propylenella binzhouense]